MFEGGEELFHGAGVTAAALGSARKGTFADDGDGDEGADEDGPHDGTAFEEELDNDVSEHGVWQSSWLDFETDDGLEQAVGSLAGQDPLLFHPIGGRAVQHRMAGGARYFDGGNRAVFVAGDEQCNRALLVGVQRELRIRRRGTVAAASVPVTATIRR